MDDLVEICKNFISGALDIGDVFRDATTMRKQQELANTYIVKAYNQTFNSDIDIRVTPKDVIHYLNQYIEGRKDAFSVKEWALFIIASDSVSFEEKPEDEDYYDAMKDAIWDMSCPAVHGELTKERAKGYIAELEKL